MSHLNRNRIIDSDNESPPLPSKLTLSIEFISKHSEEEMLFFSLPHIEDSPKRIRAYVAGACLVDTNKARLVWQQPYYPNFFFEEVELPKFYLDVAYSNSEVIVYNLKIGTPKGIPEAITLYLTGDLAGLFSIKFEAMDIWFEEDEEIHVHPKDPYKRVDVLQSSRHVRVEIDGVEVANTHAPRFLYETGLPVRTYIPKTDCRIDLWEPSETITSCPYKGQARYYNIQLSSGLYEDIVWWYRETTPEAGGVKGYVAFFDEKVDVWVDGVKQERPVTKWS